MFLDKFNKNNTIKVMDETKYKSVFDLQLECINAEYELDCILFEDTNLVIVNESVSDKLKHVAEYLKKIWNKLKVYIKKTIDYVSKKLNNISNKIKDFKNKDISIKSSFELSDSKIGQIKFISYEELESLFNLNRPDIHNDIQIRKFIEDFKDTNIDDVEKKVSEKLASALSLPVNKFNNNFNVKKDIETTIIKINTIEDLKKTKYYKELIGGNPGNEYRVLYNKISDSLSKNDNKTSSVLASITDVNHTEVGDNSNFKKFIDGNSEFNKAIDIYVKIERMIFANYVIYNNIIVRYLNAVMENYIKIIQNCKIKEDIAFKLKINNDSNKISDMANKRPLTATKTE